MKNNPFTGKSTRTKIFTVISVIAIVLLLLLNMFLTSFTIYGNGYIDLTPEGLYTLRDVMVDACKDILYDADGNAIDPGITVTFCNDVDKLIDNAYTRVVYYMCVAMSKKFDNFTVNSVNIDINPTAVAKYKTTSLTVIKSTDVIISCGSRYRILSAEDFWHIGSEKVVSYDGEYKLASVMMSLTMINRPVAYFVSNHDETYYNSEDLESAGSIETAAFAGLLMEKGFEIKNIDLANLIKEANEIGEEPSIPDDCILLIINNPRKDFSLDLSENKSSLNSFNYVSETELLDRYMTEDRGSIMVAKDYRVSLPNLEDFLKEWGIECEEELVVDEVSYIENDENTLTTIIAEYDKDTTGYGYAIYGDYVDLASAPITVVSDTGYITCSFNDSKANNEAGTYNTSRVYAPFLYTSSDALYYADDNGDGIYDALAVDRTKTKAVAIAAVAGRQMLDGDNGNRYYSYVFCAASASFFSSELIGNSSYANYDVMSALVQNIARLERYADESLGGLSVNNSNSFLGKVLVDTELKEEDTAIYEWSESVKKNVLTRTLYGLSTWEKVVFTVIIAIVPVAVVIVGIVVCVKRKYL